MKKQKLREREKQKKIIAANVEKLSQPFFFQLGKFATRAIFTNWSQIHVQQ